MHRVRSTAEPAPIDAEVPGATIFDLSLLTALKIAVFCAGLIWTFWPVMAPSFNPGAPGAPGVVLGTCANATLTVPRTASAIVPRRRLFVMGILRLMDCGRDGRGVSSTHRCDEGCGAVATFRARLFAMCFTTYCGHAAAAKSPSRGGAVVASKANRHAERERITVAGG
jgi:hypothetical protein